MRGFDRDLIRGGHYGQRSCEPRKQAEHMAAPTNAAGVKKVLANPEPSLRPVISDVNLFRYCQGIVYFDAEISDRAFDPGVPTGFGSTLWRSERDCQRCTALASRSTREL